MIKPTVGRVVWFFPDLRCGEDGFLNPKEGTPLAALIAHVHDDRLVNLAVFDTAGRSHSRRDIVLVQPNDPLPADSYAQWMPYQVGQAAKQS